MTWSWRRMPRHGSPGSGRSKKRMPYLHSMNRTIVTFCFLFIFYFSNAQPPLSEGKTLGTITDGNRKPVAGATITVLNTSYTAIADGQGQFHLPVLRPGTYTLVVSAVGFATISHPITVGGNHTEDINFQLPAANSQLDEVVVTAEKKTGSATARSPLRDSPVRTPGQRLPPMEQQRHHRHRARPLLRRPRRWPQRHRHPRFNHNLLYPRRGNLYRRCQPVQPG